MVAEFDFLIKDVTIVDGSGNPPFKGSIGVSGSRITALGEVNGDAVEVIDASGLTAAPGFIDAHSHADWTLLWYPKCESFVMQGVTTFVGGQCGGSPAPLGELVRVPRMLADHLAQLDPHKYYPKPLYPLGRVNEWMDEKYGWTIDWKTMEGFFKRVEETGISTNYAPLVGHGNIRYKVMGMDYKRHATQQEVDLMIEDIHSTMNDGCIGMSTGMDYDPDVFASQEEIIQCVSVLKEYNGVYSPHWRRTGRRRDIKIGSRIPERISGIKESIDVCRKSGVPLHFAHFHDGYEINPKPYPPSLEKANAKATLEFIDLARAEGLDVTYDYIPVGGTHLRTLPYLCSLLAPWIRETGSPERLAKFLKMEDYREDVKDELSAGKWYIRLSYNPNANPHWAENIIVLKHKNQNYENKSIAEIAELLERNQLDTFFDLISEDPYTRASVVYHHLINPSREKEKVFLKYPHASVSLDSSAYDDKYQQESPPYSLPKNGTYDGFISVLVKYVQEQKLFGIEEAIKKMSTNAADAYNIKERGRLKKGHYADIVLLDMPNLKIMSDGLEPRRYPRGLEFVFVNGVKVVERGKHTNARPANVLIRG